MTVMTCLSFAREKFLSETVNEVSKLSLAHWIEVGRKDILFQPDWALYVKGSEKGFLRFFTARNDGRLAGYATFLLGTHPHFKDVRIAAQDTFFLVHEERRGMSGVDFLKFCDRELESEGIDLIQHYSTFKRDFGSILERMGYQPVSILYERRTR